MFFKNLQCSAIHFTPAVSLLKGTRGELFSKEYTSKTQKDTAEITSDLQT
jgi:hypothetical protein